MVIITLLTQGLIGERVVVLSCSAAPDIRRRLEAMGVLCGVVLTICGHSGKDVIIKVMNTKIAIGGMLARQINVVRIPADERLNRYDG